MLDKECSDFCQCLQGDKEQKYCYSNKRFWLTRTQVRKFYGREIEGLETNILFLSNTLLSTFIGCTSYNNLGLVFRTKSLQTDSLKYVDNIKITLAKIRF